MAKQSAKDKESFAPLPLRALGDNRLTGEDIRVLAAIAAHDRFGNNGAGCYASHTRLASFVGCHLKSLSRSMRRLADAGYIVGKPNPLNQRTRIYNVIYTEFDAAYMKAGGIGTGNRTVTEDEPETTSIGNRTEDAGGAIGNRDFGIIQSVQGDASVNILGETLIDPVETVSNISRETTPRKGTPADGAMLAMIERGIKAGSIKNGGVWLRYLEEFTANHSPRDPHYGQAMRLLEEHGDVLDRMTGT